LSDYIDIPKVYPVGRLDKDSEGLVMLTDEVRLHTSLAHPKYNKTKTYIVQVEGEIDETSSILLQKGVRLKDGITNPAVV
jgi:23S rRNA pseudouridine2457 synthase